MTVPGYEPGSQVPGSQALGNQALGSHVLGMFAKAWLPGHVKTRLAATVGDAQAAEIHRLFVSHLAQRLAPGSPPSEQGEPNEGGLRGERVLAYSPACKANLFQPFSQIGWRLEPQSEGHLGQRMSAYFRRRLKDEANATALLIGSDSPDLPAELIRKAARQLERCPVVLVPSDDGGYCLVGMSRWIPAVFQEISWSTPDVLEQTRARLQAASVPCAVTEPWYDVDNQADLDRLLVNLQAASADDPAAHRLYAELHSVLH